MGGKAAAVTREKLEANFHLPMIEVAKKFDVCLTFFKRICRAHGIKRWPYRKLKSLSKKTESAGGLHAQGAAARRMEVLSECRSEARLDSTRRWIQETGHRHTNQSSPALRPGRTHVAWSRCDEDMEDSMGDGRTVCSDDGCHSASSGETMSGNVSPSWERSVASSEHASTAYKAMDMLAFLASAAAEVSSVEDTPRMNTVDSLLI